MIRCCLVLFSCLFINVAHATTIVRYIDPFYATDADNESYVVALLERVLELTEERYGPFELQPLHTPMLQGRQLRALASKEIDVMWAMTSTERENRALPVRVPIVMGLIGYRVFVIRKAEQQRFAQIDDPYELKKLLAIQGHDWPDIKILRANGFQVHGVSWRDKMYALLGGSNFDYFPRGVTEVGRELERVNKDDNLVVEGKWLLYYPAATYFFVGRENKLLAERLEQGLKEMASSGELKQMLLSHEIHQEALKLVRFHGREVIELHNPLLPPETPLQDPKYWLTYDELLKHEQAHQGQ